MSEATLEVGLLRRREARNFLSEMKWEGELSEWVEIKDWLDSRFLMRGLTPVGCHMLRRQFFNPLEEAIAVQKHAIASQKNNSTSNPFRL